MLPPLLTNVAVLPLPARLTDAGPVVALAMLLAARVACALVARGADPALLTLTLSLGADAVAATWHRAQLCQTGQVSEDIGIKEEKKGFVLEVGVNERQEEHLEESE